MSVIVMEKSEMGKLYQTLIRHRELGRGDWIPGAERSNRYSAEKLGQGNECWYKMFASCFVDRLYIANQVAYLVQYRETDSIERLDSDDLETTPFTDRQAWDFIHSIDYNLYSIDYNLYTNGGRSFLGRDDHETLDWLSMTLSNQIIRDMDGTLR